MSIVRVFLSYDMEHDDDLYRRMILQSSKGNPRFEVTAQSETFSMSGPWEEKLRRRIREADEVIVICGEHANESVPMSAELRIAQEEEKPYFLLWGRREKMCTRPSAARATDSMYSWTPEIVELQVGLTLRNSRPLEVPERCKRPRPEPRSA
jgi:TIR domain